MFLVLAPTEDEVLKIFLTAPQRRATKERCYSIRHHRLGGILSLLIKFCRQQQISFSDLDGIAVVGRTGSFTTIRLVVSLANVVAWLYKLRVVFLRAPEEIAYLKFRRGFDGFIKTVYGGAPNITHAPVPRIAGRDGAGFTMKK